MTPSEFSTLSAVTLVWLSTYLVCSDAHRRDGRFPVDDIGVVFMFFLLMYSTLPPLAWIMQGGEYTTPSRLFDLQPSGSEVSYLAFIGAAYAVGFAGAYHALYRQIAKPISHRNLRYIDNALMFSALATALICKLIIVLVSISYINDASGYIDSYRVIAESPLYVKQSLGLLGGFYTMSIIVSLVALFERWPRTNIILYLYIFLNLVMLDFEGSRAKTFISLSLLIVLWHMMVRPFSTLEILVVLILGLISFLMIGVIRGSESYMDALTGIDIDSRLLGEFDAIWANGVHILQESLQHPVDVPVGVYLQDIFAWIPSQFWPVEKIDWPNWYLNTYFEQYKAAGGGLGFGAISEAVMGFGIVEALMRGILLGMLSILLLKWVRAGGGVWWKIPLYLVLYLQTYYTVRNSTLALVGGLLNPLAAFLLIFLLSKFFPRNFKLGK